MVYDIRNPEEPDQILIGDGVYITKMEGSSVIRINDIEEGEIWALFISDIDRYIDGLKEARELWGE